MTKDMGDGSSRRPPRPDILEIHEPGAPLLVAFGGLKGNLGMPPFEFLRSTEALRAGKVFVRDPHQAWYHRGVPGLGDDIDQVAAGLARVIDTHDPARVVMTGNSAGGYAALLFSRIVPNVDAVIAFSPQTFIDRWHRAWHRDQRWRDQLRLVQRTGFARPDSLDLLHVIRRGIAPEVSTHIYVGADDRLDLVHARRMSDVPGVQVHEVREGGGHSVVRSLRDRGALTTILQASLRGDRSAGPLRA